MPQCGNRRGLIRRRSDRRLEGDIRVGELRLARGRARATGNLGRLQRDGERNRLAYRHDLQRWRQALPPEIEFEKEYDPRSSELSQKKEN